MKEKGGFRWDKWEVRRGDAEQKERGVGEETLG